MIRDILSDPITRLAVLIAATCLVILALMGPEPATDDVHSDAICTEDMACWNCETMGNMICGPNHQGHTP